MSALTLQKMDSQPRVNELRERHTRFSFRNFYRTGAGIFPSLPGLTAGWEGLALAGRPAWDPLREAVSRPADSQTRAGEVPARKQGGMNGS